MTIRTKHICSNYQNLIGQIVKQIIFITKLTGAGVSNNMLLVFPGDMRNHFGCGKDVNISTFQVA
ncbi:MAG: hypothetical protein DPW21_07535 [Anaerolineae bacterium]|nr:hypothetical protein [Anaerolineae bacterium]